MTPRGMPDWQVAGSYPRPDDLDGRGWAWQFLRRNPRYREAHAGLRHDLLDAARRGALPRHAPIGRIARYDPPALDGESLEQYESRMHFLGRTQWSSTPIEDALGADFGVECIVDPSLAQAPDALVFLNEVNVVVYGGGNRHLGDDRAVLAMDAAWDAWAKFDCRVPIEPQLRRIREALMARQWSLAQEGVEVTESKPRRDMLPMYLRLLDADAAGATVSAMASVLYPRQNDVYDRVRSQLKAAKEMRDHGYRLLWLTVG